MKIVYVKLWNFMMLLSGHDQWIFEVNADIDIWGFKKHFNYTWNINTHFWYGSFKCGY